MTVLLRALAIGIAIAGAIDPAFAVRQPAPTPIDVHAESGRAAADVRARLAGALGPDLRMATGEPPRAVVFIGGQVDPDLVPDGVPASTIAIGGSPNVRIVSVDDPPPMLPDRVAPIFVNVEASGVAGRTSVLTLEQQGLEVGRTGHVWAGDGHARVAIPFLAPGLGAHVVRVTAGPLDDETRKDDNAVDVRVVVTARPLQVLAYEPRPSWAAGFVRTALEGDATFEVASVLRPSRAIVARGGEPPRTLTLDRLTRFDAVVVGAPEELGAPGIDALGLFAARRGGAVVLIPDRRPSGAYLSLLPVRPFDEVLLEKPAVLEPGGPAGLSASEFALPRRVVAGATTIAGLRQGAGVRSAVVSWTHGEGRIIYSGALDAWRYRGDADGFGNFWRGLVAAAALAAPARVELRLDPGVAVPGAPVHLRVRLRPTEYDVAAARWSFPEIRAEWIGAGQARAPVRMWPAAAIGTFEGTFEAPAEGRYDIRVTTAGGASSDTTLIVDAGAALLPSDGGADPLLPIVAQATGGVSAGAADLSPVIAHIRSLAGPGVPTAVHPMRSPWWMLPFAAALCGEWAMRRRRGLR